MKGKRLGNWTTVGILWVTLSTVPSVAAAAAPHGSGSPGRHDPGHPTAAADGEQGDGQRPDSRKSDGQEPDGLDKLRAMLAKSGPDGKDEREAAVAQLMVMPRPDAHRLLHDRLLLRDDPDGLRLAILESLHRHLLLNSVTPFGGADEAVRRQIFTGYLGACAPLWVDAPPIEPEPGDPVRSAARKTLRGVPGHELDLAARALMNTGTPQDRAAVLRCLADMQQTLLARTIADQLEAADEVVRSAARDALGLLTFAEPPIRTKADFEAWSERSGSLPYVDLATRAARSGPQRYAAVQRQLEEFRVAAAREFVTVLVETRPGIDWAAVQERTVSDGPSVLDACLEALQTVLARSTAIEGGATQRHAFFRALLDRFAKVPASPSLELQRRRALLLEVAAYLVRPEETEQAGEIRGLLLAQLEVPNVDSQVAALRGLRRFPSDAARAALIDRARTLLDEGGDDRPLQAILETLAWRPEPRWMAPAGDAADKDKWLALVRDSARSDPKRELRRRALLLAQTRDRKDACVPEAFDVVLGLVRDGNLDTKFRKTCLIYLEAWRDVQDLAERWLEAVHGLLESTEQELRLQAAQSLVALPASTDSRLSDWFAKSLMVLRSRLILETDLQVLKALVECVKVIGREPQMPERAIGAIKFVLGQLGDPISENHRFRLDPLLQALATIAADQSADRGQWLAACEPLRKYGKRDFLRVILQGHAAIDLAQEVRRDGGAGERACQAMRLVIQAAALRQDAASWRSTPQLEAEAREVVTAFSALDKVDVAQRLDEPKHRLLRLAVYLAAEKYQEVGQRASAWLAEVQPPAGADEAYRDQLRLYSAEAQLALKKPLPALAQLEACGEATATSPAALDLGSRLATALVDSDLPRAVTLFEKTMRATPPDAPAFRARLLDWMRYRIRQAPESRDATLAEGEKHRALFDAPDCPPKLREAWEQLRSSN